MYSIIEDEENDGTQEEAKETGTFEAYLIEPEAGLKGWRKRYGYIASVDGEWFASCEMVGMPIMVGILMCGHDVVPHIPYRETLLVPLSYLKEELEDAPAELAGALKMITRIEEEIIPGLVAMMAAGETTGSVPPVNE